MSLTKPSGASATPARKRSFGKVAAAGGAVGLLALLYRLGSDRPYAGSGSSCSPSCTYTGSRSSQVRNSRPAAPSYADSISYQNGSLFRSPTQTRVRAYSDGRIETSQRFRGIEGDFFSGREAWSDWRRLD